MRRNSRKKINQGKTLEDKIIMYGGVAVLILGAIVLGLFIYSKNINENVKNGSLTSEQIASIINNTNTESESASTSIGKSVEESQETENNTTNSSYISNNTNTINATNTTPKTNTTSSKTNKSTLNNTQTNKSTTSTKKTESNTTSNETTVKKELSFQKPVEGEIVREFAKDNLIYSETLQEWVTHSGIDIKADKTTVVKSAEEGTVKSIKNDPRFGLTVVVEHQEGFQTVYSNLLTSEFVVEGEKIEKGQSIGTVGNTAVFEIADEPHLHFEILKDSLAVDPSIYLI